MLQQQALSHSVQSSTLADVLERVLDKGIVIAGDIRVKLVDIELLSIQIRLVICSVDKAKEMGMDWWVNNPIFRQDKRQEIAAASLTSLEARMATLEQFKNYCSRASTGRAALQRRVPADPSPPSRLQPAAPRLHK
jgi:hypothetical protein